MNITFLNNKVFKLYDSENTAESLTLRFLKSDYSLDVVKDFFDQANVADVAKEIIKTNDEGTYVCTFSNYTSVSSVAEMTVDVVSESTKEIASLDESGKEITTSVPTTETKQVELVVVVLKYVDPTVALVDKLDKQINPTIDVDTCTLDELKKYRQAKNKEAMNDFFRNNPMKHTDGLYYGVEDEDRSEMTEEYMGYMMEKTSNPKAKLEWHSKGSACTERTEEEFGAIAIAVRAYTKPYFNKMQAAKEAIFSAKDKDAVMAVKIFGEE
ncbi:hypothetical protein [Clostridium sp. AF32-12BH]|uniref:hypothetical protein n=1 Tax=Clostridium sp. AF32-12BH TaxID=2292006 RepID=UPI000E507F29|nr:hypothetical protein [Clostridium sp. AF32-12BH]RHP45342.1 hypothetical protein DWZ40_13100 [Clostridium sp. AF32-12BH]